MPSSNSTLTVPRLLGASLFERARWFTKQRQVRMLSDQLGIPHTFERDLETLQTLASIKAHLNEPIRTIVDVGAHVGAFAEPAVRALQADEVVCIEPYAPLHAQLRWRLAGLKHQIIECALAERSRTGTLRVHADRSMTTLLDVNPRILAEHFNAYDDSIQSIPVRINTLDNVLSPLSLAEPFFLKLDTQGTELEIVRGAADTLRRTSAVLVEHMFTTPYQGTASFSQLVILMEQSGFTCAAATAIKRRVTNRVSAVDFLFCRRA